MPESRAALLQRVRCFEAHWLCKQRKCDPRRAWHLRGDPPTFSRLSSLNSHQEVQFFRLTQWGQKHHYGLLDAWEVCLCICQNFLVFSPLMCREKAQNSMWNSNMPNKSHSSSYIRKY